MIDLRLRLLAPLALVASVGCSDDIPPIPGGNDDTTGGEDTTSGITTFPTTMGPDPGTTTTGTEETDGDSTTSTDTTTATEGTTGPGTTSEGESSSSDGEGSSSGGSSSSSGGADDDTIYEIQDGTIPTGMNVDVQGVVVTGVGSSGFFAEEPGGGQYSGVYVYVAAVPLVAIGDEIDILGVTAEFDGLTEIDASAGAVNPTGGTGIVLVPDLVAVADLDALTGEPWEGVLVRIEGAPLDVVGLPGFDEFDVGDGGVDTARIDNFLYSVFDFPAVYTSFGIGASFTAIQGPLNFTFGEYKVAPRMDTDLEGYMGAPPPMGTTVDDLVPGDLVVTEVMFDPLCANDDCEWIEVYNASGVEVNLNGLRIQDSAFSVASQGTISVDVFVPAGDFAVLGSDSAAVWPYAVPADGHYGTSPGFNNTGDLVAILNSTEILDQTAVYPTFGVSDNGISWKLDPVMLDAVSNDSDLNWCFSTMIFDSPGGMDEYGTPGAINEAACAML